MIFRLRREPHLTMIRAESWPPLVYSIKNMTFRSTMSALEYIGIYSTTSINNNDSFYAV